MNPFTKIWFWLLLFSIIALIIFIVFFESQGEVAIQNDSTSAWIWVMFIVSIIFLILSLIIYCLDVAAYYKRMEIAKSCGLLIEPEKKCLPCEAPKIVCNSCD